jgi:hypothetical protein
MIRRPVFWVLLVFWLAMNTLLWWREWGPAQELRDRLPNEVVWEKILAAPDASSLEIFHGPRKLGYCRWIPTILQTGTTNDPADDEMEGQIRQVAGYTLELEAHFFMDAFTNRWRGLLRLEFGPDRQWKDFNLRIKLNTGTFEAKTQSSEQVFKLKFEDRATHWEQQFTLADLQNPARVMADLGLPAMLFMPVAQLGMSTNSMQLGVTWQSRNDWLQLGHARTRAYRIEARLLDRYSIGAWISRGGELLRVDLPDGWRLINEIFAGWQKTESL